MRHYTYTTEQWVPAPIDEVFAFFADPQNLPRLSPPDLDITEFVWGRMFRDQSAHWPFLRWDHKHEFAPLVRNGVHGTLIRDMVRYSLGPSLFGGLLHWLFVGKAVAQMFAYRQRALEKIIGAGALIGHGFVPATQTA